LVAVRRWNRGIVRRVLTVSESPSAEVRIPVSKGRIGVLALAAAVAILAAGCASNPCSSRGGGAGSCKAILKFRHRLYLGTAVRIHSHKSGHVTASEPRLHKIGVAVQPACIDTNCRSSADVPEHFEVGRIEGVDPTIAIVMRWGFIYVRPGVAADRRSIERLIQPDGRPGATGWSHLTAGEPRTRGSSL